MMFVVILVLASLGSLVLAVTALVGLNVLEAELDVKRADYERGLLLTQEGLNAAVMARLRVPFGCEFIPGNKGDKRWRIHDANDDAIASVSPHEEGYARLIVQALNEHFERR